MDIFRSLVLQYRKRVGLSAWRMHVERRKVGLVLSGGGARGLAHLGVLSVLEEHNIFADLIVGTSFGSIVAGYYGMGYSVDDMKNKAEEFKTMITQQDTRLLCGFSAGEKAEKFLKSDFGDTRIEELRLPVFVLAVDITSSDMHVFSDGPIFPAIRASSSFPGLFPPLLLEGHRYIDGGILNSMMLKVAKKRGADLIIFSDVSVFGVIYRKPSLNFLLHLVLRFISSDRGEQCEEEDKDGLFRTGRRVFRAVKKYKRQCELYRKTLVDFLVEPSLKKMRPLDFHKDKEAFASGREAGYAQIGKILRAINPS